MLKPFNFWCQKVLPLVYDKTLGYYETLCKVVAKLNEVVASTNHWQEIIDGWQAWALGLFVRKTDMPDVYKLDDTGNFTGTLSQWRWTADGTITTVDSNKDKIAYLISQFQDGQTGMVIDGGFFDQTAIKRNYNGGVF